MVEDLNTITEKQANETGEDKTEVFKIILK
jgi:hypothetical protein